MDIKTIGVEEWLNVWEKSATWDIAQSTISSLTIVSVNIFFTIFTNVFSPIAPTRMRRIRQRGCAAFGV